jgi:hypothetical protein
LVPEGTGWRLALDRDDDGYFDTSEIDVGFDPANSESCPGAIMSIGRSLNDVTLSWSSAPGAQYAVEWSTNLSAPNINWISLGPPFSAMSPLTFYTHAATNSPGFYRVRMER